MSNTIGNAAQKDGEQNKPMQIWPTLQFKF